MCIFIEIHWESLNYLSKYTHRRMIYVVNPGGPVPIFRKSKGRIFHRTIQGQLLSLLLLLLLPELHLEAIERIQICYSWTLGSKLLNTFDGIKSDQIWSSLEIFRLILPLSLDFLNCNTKLFGDMAAQKRKYSLTSGGSAGKGADYVSWNPNKMNKLSGNLEHFGTRNSNRYILWVLNLCAGKSLKRHPKCCVPPQKLVWLGRFQSRRVAMTEVCCYPEFQALPKRMCPDIQELAMRRAVMLQQCWEMDDVWISLKSFNGRSESPTVDICTHICL